LRKHQDFLKVQEEVTKAQHNYNRILGYSKEEGDNAEYWKNQLPFYQKTIHLAKEKVQEEVDILSQKGVNVMEIAQQTKITEDKIAELDKKLEDLANVREGLVSKYREEKEIQLKINERKDYVEERKVENSVLFSGSKLGLIEKEIKLMKIDDVNKKYYNKR
jgi:DNA-binding transcriptional regulator GbsR (MarR family)